jgi:hypothetical protein
MHLKELIRLLKEAREICTNADDSNAVEVANELDSAINVLSKGELEIPLTCRTFKGGGYKNWTENINVLCYMYGNEDQVSDNEFDAEALKD